MTRGERSQGAVMLARVGATQEAIAARANIDRTLVARYISGDRKPPTSTRAVFKRLYGIPVGAWDMAPTAPPMPELAPAEQNGEWSLHGRAKRLERVFDAMLHQIETDPSVTPFERTKLGIKATQMLGEIGKLTGESAEVNEAKLLRLPAFRKVLETIVAALKPWPEAARAVAVALEELGT